MIVTKLTGGLANQMFQYAAGLALAKRLGTTLKIDLSWYETDEKRKFSLNDFKISAKSASLLESFIIKNPPFGKTFNEPYFQFTPEFFNQKNNTYLNGYWQSEKYFSDTVETIRNEFTLKKKFEGKILRIAEMAKNTNSVSIHVRRSDYLQKTDTYEILTPEYYKNAISKISEAVENPKYFLFSDDINWIKKNVEYPKDSVIVSETGAKDYEELAIMSLCKHNVIANSSFSWWGAWLNSNNDKIVITPTKWFSTEIHDTKDLIPSNWLRL